MHPNAQPLQPSDAARSASGAMLDSGAAGLTPHQPMGAGHSRRTP
ncbi:hypothetical protein [Acidovorax sp. Root267]|nr:hypothetical protein [Acidovorax sp. Root267]